MPKADSSHKVSLYPKPKTIVLMHVLLCSIALLAIAFGAALFVYERLPLERLGASLNDFFGLFMYSKRKPLALLTYVFGVGFLFIYYSTIAVLIKRLQVFERSSLLIDAFKSPFFVACYLAVLLVVNVAIFLVTVFAKAPVVLFGVLWLLVALAPFYELAYREATIVYGRIPFRARRRIGFAIVTVLLVHVVTIFFPFVAGRFKVINDYMDIPEQTRLGDHYVDNTAYINEHRLGGIIKYDPRTGQGSTPAPRAGTFLEFPKSARLMAFISSSYVDPHKLGFAASQTYRPTRYYYDDARHGLIITGTPTDDEIRDLINIADTPSLQKAIGDFWYSSAKNTSQANRRDYTAEELDFFRYNRIELIRQTHAAWYFHHHSHVFAPILRYASGVPFDKLDAQYGTANTVVLATLMKAFGGMTFNNYIRWSFVAYPLYMILFVAVAFVILRRISYVAIATILSVSSLLLVGYELISVAPGFNPIRHFLDIFVLVALYQYLVSRRPLYAGLSILFGTCAFISSPDFGLFIIGALILTFAVRAVAERSRLDGIAAAACVAIVVMLRFIISADQNPTTVYYLMGLASPPLNYKILFASLVLISCLYITTFYLWNTGERGRDFYVFLFLFLYTQGLITYYLWYPALHHLLAIAPIWSLMLVTLLKIFLTRRSTPRRAPVSDLVAPLLAGTLLIVVYIPAAAIALISWANVEAVFKTHTVYRWNFPTMHFESTMDPAGFVESAHIIDKYVPEPGVFIISKYDTLLPYLVGKYSAMPFINVSTNIVSSREVDRCIDLLNSQRPKYIVVDTDIERSLNGEIFNIRDPVTRSWKIYEESFARVMVLRGLGDVYRGIKSQYEPIEKGQLITIYRRKEGPHSGTEGI